MIEIVGLMREKISYHTPDVSDTMFATVLQLGVIEVTLLNTPAFKLI